MKKWVKLSRKTLLKHPRITIVEDEVRLPNGHVTHYLHFENADNASQVIVVNHDGKILVQSEYSYPPNEWLYQFPGGKIDAGESPLEAAKRELAEESKISAELEPIGWFYPDNRRKDAKFHVFIGRNDTEITTHNPDDEEAFEHFWFTEQQVEQMIQDGKIVNYSFLAAWALYKARKTR